MLVEELTGFIAYCCAERKNKEATVAEAGSSERLSRAVRGVTLTAAALSDQGGEKDDQEGARGGREPDEGEEAANVRDYQGIGGEHRRMGCLVENSADWLGLVVPAVAEGIRIVRRGGKGGAPGLLLEERRHSLLERSVQLGPERRVADTVEVHFEGGEDDQGRKEAVMVKTKRAKRKGGLGANVVDLLVELFDYYGNSIPGVKNAPLMARRSRAECRVWTRGQATYRLRSGLERVGEK